MAVVEFDTIFEETVALYHSGKQSAEPWATIDVRNYLKWVRSGNTPQHYKVVGERWKVNKAMEVMAGSANTIRQLREGVKDAEKKALKRDRLTGATFSHCNPTGNKTGIVLKRQEAGNEDHGTNLVSFDIDGIETVKQAEAERDRLFKEIPFVLSSSLSASGKGVWLLIALSRQAKDKIDFANIWWMLAVELQEKYGVTIGGTSGKGSTDTAPSNMVSLRFYTYDPAIWVREDKHVTRYDLPEPDAMPTVNESHTKAGLLKQPSAKTTPRQKQTLPSTDKDTKDTTVGSDVLPVIPKHKDADRFVEQCRWMLHNDNVFIPNRAEYSGFIIRAKSMGLPTEQIIAICRTQPNFDEATDPQDIANVQPKADVDDQVAIAFKKLLDFGYDPKANVTVKKPQPKVNVAPLPKDPETNPPANKFVFNDDNFKELEALDTTNQYFVPKKITALFADAGVGKTGLYLYWIAQASQAGKKILIIANDMSKEEFRPYYHAYGMVQNQVTLFDEEETVFEEDLIRFIKAEKPDIIVIDTFDSWLEQVTDSFLEPGTEFNVKSASHWVKARKWLQKIIAKHKIAVLAIFHVPQKSNPFMLPHSSKLKGLLFRTWLLVAKDNGQLKKWGRNDIANCLFHQRDGTIVFYPDKQRSCDRQEPRFFNFDRDLPDDVQLNPDDQFKPKLPSGLRRIPYEKHGEFFSGNKTSEDISDEFIKNVGKTSDKTSEREIDVSQKTTVIEKVRHLAKNYENGVPEGKIVDNFRRYNPGTVYRMLREASRDGLLVGQPFGRGDKMKFSIPADTN